MSNYLPTPSVAYYREPAKTALCPSGQFFLPALSVPLFSHSCSQTIALLELLRTAKPVWQVDPESWGSVET